MFRPLLIASSAALALGCAVAHAQSSSTVTLLQPGTGQLQPLRYRFQSGRSETAKMDTTMQLTMVASGMQVPMGASTPISIQIQLRTAEVGADGSAKMRFEVISAEAGGDSATAAQLNPTLASMKGLSGSYSLDTRGQVSGSQMGAPRAAAGIAPTAEDLQEQMQQLALPLPAEPVGIGARWRAIQQTSANGLEVTQTTEYTLRSRNADEAEVEVKIIDVSLPDLSGMVPGAEVSSATMTGGGTMKIGLGSLVPRGSLDVEMAIAMSMALQGTTQSMALHMKMNQAVAPAAPRPN
ncbi:MAG TPA: hypothetical protein VNQ32_01885 [Steroidobacteraceae bacterium]|nr:hypothetical protein [Steroidobacteraceae bacterium]